MTNVLAMIGYPGEPLKVLAGKESPFDKGFHEAVARDGDERKLILNWGAVALA